MQTVLAQPSQSSFNAWRKGGGLDEREEVAKKVKRRGSHYLPVLQLQSTNSRALSRSLHMEVSRLQGKSICDVSSGWSRPHASAYRSHSSTWPSSDNLEANIETICAGLGTDHPISKRVQELSFGANFLFPAA